VWRLRPLGHPDTATAAPTGTYLALPSRLYLPIRVPQPSRRAGLYPRGAGHQPGNRRLGPARPRSSAAARRSPALPTGPRRPATSAATILFFTGVKGTRSALIMFPVARAAQSLVARSIRHTAVRQAHRKHEPNFHDKYGTTVLLGGAAMFSAVWAYVSCFCHRSLVTAAANSKSVNSACLK
uniref:Cytochrome c oxidase subunit 7B, mitochondrial n=1 Tax=Cyanoderma ruficeps TaxID=181631 RepID=A0A8C3NZH3_9PASS